MIIFLLTTLLLIHTVDILRKLASQDRRVKVILNTRNYGQIRSPYHALMQASGDAVIGMSSDLQDPPEMIPEFIKQWEQGYKVVVGVKTKSEEFGLFYLLRSLYYLVLRKLSDTHLIDNFTGFGLYDKQVVDILRKFDDPYPYFRGLIADIGFEYARIEFTQPRRKRGISKNNFYTLYDMAMLGVTSYTKIPLRLATMLGFISAFLSFVVGLGLSGIQTDRLAELLVGSRSGDYWLILYGIDPTLFPWYRGRVYWINIYLGGSPSIGDRKRAD